MGTVDHNCGGTLPAAAARPWHALTASLSVVVCCFVWLCVRQCHELIMKARAEQSQRAGARALAWVAAAANQARHSFLTVTGHEIRATLNPALGLTTLVVIPLLDAQPRMPAEAMFEPGDKLLYALNDALDFSTLETARLELEQHAFSAESLVDRTVIGMADVWSDQQVAGSWMADFGSDRADIFWQDADVMPVLASMDSYMPSDDNVGFNPGLAWQAYGAFDFETDAAPGAWMDALDMVSDSDAGFISAASWQDVQPYYDLV
jgi:hypothetical protein